MRTALTVLLLFCLTGAGCVSAQTVPDSVKQRNDCRLAEQVVRTGHPAPKREWALWEIRRHCGASGGRALADAIREHRTSRDTAWLGELTSPAIQLRDGAVFAVSAQIARDRSASPEARVFAIRTLIWSLRPGYGITYDDLAGAGEGSGGCYSHGPELHFQPTDGAPLPAGHASEVQAVAEQILLDAAEPAPVRSAARCALLASRRPSRAR